MSISKAMENAEFREINQIVYHSKGLDESYPKMQILSKSHKICQFENHVTRNDIIMMSIPKAMENAEFREINQIVYHSKGLHESYPKMQILSNLNSFVKTYRHSSEILALSLQHSPNMVKSRDYWC